MVLVSQNNQIYLLAIVKLRRLYVHTFQFPYQVVLHEPGISASCLLLYAFVQRLAKRCIKIM